MNFDRPVQNHILMMVTIKRSKSKPKVAFQYDGRLIFKIGSFSILAMN